jgi:hypothetical protein
MNYHDKGIIEGIAWRKQKLIVWYQLGGLAACKAIPLLLR